MKKIIFVTALIGVVSTSSAFAKTEGNYLGIDLLRGSMKSASNSTADADAVGVLPRYYHHNARDFSYGVGVSYKYAFSFDKFFVAPGVSFDLINNQTTPHYGNPSNYFSQKIGLRDRASLKANLGYDINDAFAVYVPIGVSSVRYNIRTNDVNTGNVVSSSKTGRKASLLIGIGFSYQPLSNWVVNLEYNKFRDLNLLTSSTATFSGGRIKAKVDSDMIRLGVAYKF